MPLPFRRLGFALARGYKVPGEPPDCVNVNYYKDGQSHLGPHSDNEPLFAATTQAADILSISFGDTRNFSLQWKGSKVPSNITLEHCDVVRMSGWCQKYVSHGLPKLAGSKYSGGRWNLTFRWIVNHCPTCPKCKGN